MSPKEITDLFFNLLTLFSFWFFLFLFAILIEARRSRSIIVKVVNLHILHQKNLSKSPFFSWQ